MSRAAEEAAVREMERDREECTRLMTPGAVVYRARYDRVEEGVVRAVGRCDNPDPDRGWRNPKGAYPYWSAQFVGSNPTGCRADFNGDWESQTYSWRFFLRKEDAHKALVRQVERRVEDSRRELSRHEAFLEKLRKTAP